MNPKPIITSSTVLAALESKHAEDVFVSECKDGPTQSVSNYLRLDAWVMNKSWSNPRMVGYEIKVSRSDFLNDHKWNQYLPLCNEFYFAAPKGLIQIEELPKDVGLIELLGTSRLVTRRKAVRREIEFPSLLVTYVLMCRTKIKWEDAAERDKTQHWREILDDKDRRAKVGLLISGAIQKHVSTVEDENRQLRDKQRDYDAVIKCMTAMGIDPECFSTWNIEHRIKMAQQVFPESLTKQIDHVRAELGRILDEVEKLKPPTV